MWREYTIPKDMAHRRTRNSYPWVSNHFVGQPSDSTSIFVKGIPVLLPVRKSRGSCDVPDENVRNPQVRKALVGDILP